ncbi:UNVERIFIED_CONTAM: hypothetical protein K2H54_050822 [Gekko kuhli]
MPGIAIRHLKFIFIYFISLVHHVTFYSIHGPAQQRDIYVKSGPCKNEFDISALVSLFKGSQVAAAGEHSPLLKTPGRRCQVEQTAPSKANQWTVCNSSFIHSLSRLQQPCLISSDLVVQQVTNEADTLYKDYCSFPALF